MMSHEYRTLLALTECEGMVSDGARVPTALESAANAYQVSPGKLAMLMLAKVIACGRARAERDAEQLTNAAPSDSESTRT